MRRHVAIVVVLWLALTVTGELWVLTSRFLPSGFAEQAELVDEAFRLQMVLAVPVFTLVIAALVYSVLRFRARGEPTEEGPALHTSTPLAATWVAVSTALCLTVIVNPGIVGLHALRAHAQHQPDLVVRVEGSQWAWRISYPEHGVSSYRLVLPKDRLVRFEVSSTDVIHSFWVPAFRMKIDAVPGMVTTVYATPDRTGVYEKDSTLRLQCAELCGMLHSRMTNPVTVMEPQEFDAWIAQQKSGR